MKLKVLIIAILISTALFAQEPKTTPPVIVAKTALGETLHFDGATFTFLKVTEDSRCPKDVDCVWAGQAKVLVEIKTPSQTTQKELVFHGEAFGTEAENTMLTTATKKYIGYRLSPYPETSIPQNHRIYVLEIYVQ